MTTSLSREDIVLVRNIIDVCQQRGAFRAAEMTLIGKLFEKVSKMLEDEKASEEKSDQRVGQATPPPQVTKLA